MGALERAEQGWTGLKEGRSAGRLGGAARARRAVDAKGPARNALAAPRLALRGVGLAVATGRARYGGALSG